MMNELVIVLLVSAATAHACHKETRKEPTPAVQKQDMDKFADLYGDEVRSLTKEQLIELQVEAELNAETESLAICGELWKKLAADWAQMRVLMHDKSNLERYTIASRLIDERHVRVRYARERLFGARYAYMKHYGRWPSEKETDLWLDTARNVLRIKGPCGELVLPDEAVRLAYEEFRRR